jgi:hypothetical protein
MQLPGEQLLIKLTEVLAGGVGTLTRPWVIRREARANAIGQAEARRIERLAQEQLRQHVRDVRAGRKTIDSEFRLIEAAEDGGAVATKSEIQRVKSDYVEYLHTSSMAHHDLIELERKINLDQISSLVVEEVEAEGNPGADREPIDPDWFTQWRNRAQDVSNEEMQRLWARVLKGQAKAIGSYSIHTMDFLSRMSREDAELIAKLGSFVLDDRHVFSGTTVALEAADLTLQRLLYLSDLGLLSGVDGFATLTWETAFVERGAIRSAVVRLRNKTLILTPKNATQQSISFVGYPVSVVARELLALAGCEPNIGYLREVADAVREECESITIGDVVTTGEPKQYRVKIIGPI